MQPRGCCDQNRGSRSVDFPLERAPGRKDVPGRIQGVHPAPGHGMLRIRRAFPVPVQGGAQASPAAGDGRELRRIYCFFILPLKKVMFARASLFLR